MPDNRTWIVMDGETNLYGEFKNRAEAEACLQKLLEGWPDGPLDIYSTTPLTDEEKAAIEASKAAVKH